MKPHKNICPRMMATCVCPRCLLKAILIRKRQQQQNKGKLLSVETYQTWGGSVYHVMLHSLSKQCFRDTPVKKSQAFQTCNKCTNVCIKYNSIFVKQRETASIYSYNISHVHLCSWCLYMSVISGCVLEERMSFFTMKGVQIISDLFIYTFWSIDLLQRE